MGTINVKNVITDFGATGNGTTDDTTAIQNALDAAQTDGGGIVFFPKGIFLISDSLRLPSLVQMVGIAGTTFGGPYDIAYSTPENFITQEISIIKLAGGANLPMLVPKNNLNVLFNSSVENLCFFGNKSNQTSFVNGINLPNILNVSNSERGQNKFKNILIYSIKGTGFFAGDNHHELHMDNVICYDCGGNGLEINGEDSKFFKVQAGRIGGVGIKIKRGAHRFFDCDVWECDTGVEILDALNIYFFGLNASTNKKYGLYIHQGSLDWSPAQIQVFRANFDQNSHDANGIYPDIQLSSTFPVQGPSGIFFECCQFRGSEVSPKENYAIVDDSYLPARNIVSNCFFNRANYTSGVINNKDIYCFKNCYDYTTRAVMDELNVPYRYSSVNYTILLTDCYLTVSAASGNKTITLPTLNTTRIGKIFIISKTESSANSVTIVAGAGDSIQGENVLNGAYQSALVVNAGANWYSIKIR